MVDYAEFPNTLYQSVLFQGLQAGYNAVTRTVSVPKPDPNTGFMRVHADRKVQLVNPSVNATNITAQIK